MLLLYTPKVSYTNKYLSPFHHSLHCYIFTPQFPQEHKEPVVLLVSKERSAHRERMALLEMSMMGDVGDKGSRGVMGDQGDKGMRGPPGRIGPSGKKGDRGCSKVSKSMVAVSASPSTTHAAFLLRLS